MILAARLFTVLAAVMGVVTVAVAALLPVGYALADALVLAQPDAVDWLRNHATPFWWNSFETPLLARPAWMLPAMLCIVFGGAATTVSLPKLPSRRQS